MVGVTFKPQINKGPTAKKVMEYPVGKNVSESTGYLSAHFKGQVKEIEAKKQASLQGKGYFEQYQQKLSKSSSKTSVLSSKTSEPKATPAPIPHREHSY